MRENMKRAESISSKLQSSGRCDHLYHPLTLDQQKRKQLAGDVQGKAGDDKSDVLGKFGIQGGGVGSITFLEESELASKGVRSALKVRQAFQFFLKKYDTDGSGKLELTEFSRILQERGKCKLSEEASAKMMRHLDKDGNGCIDEDEFVAWSLGQNIGEGVGATDLQDRKAAKQSEPIDPVGDGLSIPGVKTQLPVGLTFGTFCSLLARSKAWHAACKSGVDKVGDELTETESARLADAQAGFDAEKEWPVVVEEARKYVMDPCHQTDHVIRL